MAHVGIGADLEGIHAVAAALDAGRVTELIVERSRMSHPEVRVIVERAGSGSIPVTHVDDVRQISYTDAPQGVVARAEPISPISLKGAVGITDNPIIVVLDHIEDPRNIGAIARSCDAFGVTAIVLSTRRGAPLGATAFKAASGSLERLPIVTVSSIADVAKRLSQLGLWTVGLDGTGDRSLLGLEILAQPTALFIGAEGAGLSHLVAQRCDVVAALPMVGQTESLNASVAVALGTYEVARVRGWVS
jgi:23S rRNA (guanosine2251-2'-O)-methyltransferase